MESRSSHLVTIFESWKLSFRNEILADIQHSLNGLPPGTILKSTKSGLRWKVISRTIFIQAEIQKRFHGEKETIQHFSFKAPFEETFEQFRNDIAEKERKGIYKYSLEPVGHESKPIMGDMLEVVFEI